MKNKDNSVSNSNAKKLNRKERRALKRKGETTASKVLRRFFVTIGTSALVCTGLGLCVAGGVYFHYKDDISHHIQEAYKKVENVNVNTFNHSYSTKVLDKDGKVLQEFKTNNYNYQPYKDINKKVFDALISVEDNRYYNHKALDFKGLMRAGVVTLTTGHMQGGSTITQQLAKNVYLTMDRTMWRKLEEAVIAEELEKKFSKEDILEFYVNNVNYGNGCYSIESASHYYFGKETEDLNVAEIAMLVGIPNNPSLFNPVTNFKNALNRKDKILKDMFNSKKLTEEEYNKAKAVDIKLDIHPTKINNEIKNSAVNYAIQHSVEEMMKHNGFQFKYKFDTEEERNKYFELYNEEYAKNRDELIFGGYTINTTIDKSLQDKLQKTVDKRLSGYTAKNPKTGLYKKQSSATVMDNETGNIVAIVGGRDEDGNTFNRAVMGARQPGSSAKPLLSYLPAFERGYSPDDYMEDRAISNGPKNWYRYYKGDVSLRYATEISINTIPYRLTAEVGTDNAMQYLANMHFKYLTPSDSKYPIVAVGGWSRGTTTLEMTSAFATIARNGEYIEPSNVASIEERGTDKVIYKNKHLKTRIYDAGASYLMTDTLKGVLDSSEGTGKSAKLRNFKYQAGKTGTTDASRDAWFIGYTPYYSMSVWTGDDIPAPQSMSSTTVSGMIWRDFMEYLHEGKKEVDFKKPDTVYRDSRGALRTKLEPKDKLLKERANLEETRKFEENKAQQKRLGESEYRIKYGLSDEEEKSRETIAENSLKQMNNFNLDSLNKQEDLNKLIEQTKRSIDDVKRKSAKSKYQSEYEAQFDRLNSRLYQLKEQERLKQEKIQQEQFEKERQKRLEQEKLEQAQLEQQIKDEQNKELQNLEKEKLNNEENNPNNNSENSNLVN